MQDELQLDCGNGDNVPKQQDKQEKRRLVATLRASEFAADQLAYWRCQRRALKFADWLCNVAFAVYERHCKATRHTRSVSDGAALCAAIVERQGRVSAVDPHFSSYIASHPAICAALFIAQCIGGDDVENGSLSCSIATFAQRLTTVGDGETTQQTALHDVCDAIVDDWASGVERANTPHFSVQAVWLTCIGGERSHSLLRKMLHAIVDQYASRQQ